jgi:hypothetical protein
MTSMSNEPDSSDQRYLDLLVGAIRASARYKPMFGQARKEGLTLAEFRQLYGSDPFYNWVGLDSPFIYAAHKAAGGLTSIYRQLGIGCEWIFRQLLKDTLGLSDEQAAWKYEVPTSGSKQRVLTLDGRVDLDHLKGGHTKSRIAEWIVSAGAKALVPDATLQVIRGAVFEVRQGYKSMDAKRQNADIANASSAYANRYLPVLFLLSTQIDSVLVERYTQAHWVILRGFRSGTPFDSSYAFTNSILGYDLAAFFERNSPKLRVEIEQVVQTLLST